MIRNRSDQLGKNIFHDALRHCGEVRPEAEVPPGDAQRIDIWYVPEVTRQRAGPSLTGLFAQLAQEAALIELWSDVPQEKAFHACLRKRYAWHHVLEMRDERDWMMPPLWGISSGRPEGLLERFGFEPAPEGPRGHYRTSAPGWQVRMVVVSELPRVRDTILLRLLGRAPVRKRALADLAALEEAAWERQVAVPWLIRLGFESSNMGSSNLTPEDKEFAMDVHEWYEKHTRELREQAIKEGFAEGIEKGIEQGIEKGIEKGIEQGIAEGRLEGQLQPLVHQFERRLARPLTHAERARLGERLREQGAERVSDVVLDLSPQELATWLATTNGH